MLLMLLMFPTTKRPRQMVEARKGEVENNQRREWLKHKGMDTFDAMQLYIEKVKELAQIYSERQIDNNNGEDGLKKK